jgi:hypothetical protein
MSQSIHEGRKEVDSRRIKYEQESKLSISHQQRGLATPTWNVLEAG